MPLVVLPRSGPEPRLFEDIVLNRGDDNKIVTYLPENVLWIVVGTDSSLISQREQLRHRPRVAFIFEAFSFTFGATKPDPVCPVFRVCRVLVFWLDGSRFLVFWLAFLMLAACHSLSLSNNEEVRDFNAGGALVMAHSHTNEFLCDGPTQPSDVSFALTRTEPMVRFLVLIQDPLNRTTAALVQYHQAAVMHSNTRNTLRKNVTSSITTAVSGSGRHQPAKVQWHSFVRVVRFIGSLAKFGQLAAAEDEDNELIGLAIVIFRLALRAKTYTEQQVTLPVPHDHTTKPLANSGSGKESRINTFRGESKPISYITTAPHAKGKRFSDTLDIYNPVEIEIVRMPRDERT
ncbi:hypothetical protein BDR04DRAFT_1122496 [Suillus decipiens]|nr:hypothetical protein BDR04DRAFT_1122496 [Suillus decipiens]